MVGGRREEGGEERQGCNFSRVLVIHGKEAVQTLCPTGPWAGGVWYLWGICGSPAEKKGARVYKGGEEGG